MTTPQKIKSEYNRRYSEKKKANGWRIYSFILPVEIGTELVALKRTRMDEYRRKRVEADEEKAS